MDVEEVVWEGGSPEDRAWGSHLSLCSCCWVPSELVSYLESAHRILSMQC